MAVEERRRIALHRHAQRTWGEEAADTLLDLVTPSGQELATARDVEGLRQDMHVRFEWMDARMDARFALADERAEAMEHRILSAFERRIGGAVTTQTRTLVLSQLAALVTIAALAFGFR